LKFNFNILSPIIEENNLEKIGNFCAKPVIDEIDFYFVLIKKRIAVSAQNILTYKHYLWMV